MAQTRLWLAVAVRVLVTVVLAAALLVAVPTVASALWCGGGGNTCAETTDGGDVGGRITYYKSENQFTVCDTDNDGVRANGKFRYWRSGVYHYTYLSALGNGNCEDSATFSAGIVNGITIQVKVCLWNGSNPSSNEFACSDWEVGDG